MTYLLVCALCAGTAGDLVPREAAPDAPRLALDLERDVPALGLALAGSEPVPLANHSGYDGGSGAHMGPMWIVMGVMMVAMMVALGVYMMRANDVSAFETGAVSAPHVAAVPVGAGFRPGG